MPKVLWHTYNCHCLREGKTNILTFQPPWTLVFQKYPRIIWDGTLRTTDCIYICTWAFYVLPFCTRWNSFWRSVCSCVWRRVDVISCQNQVKLSRPHCRYQLRLASSTNNNNQCQFLDLFDQQNMVSHRALHLNISIPIWNSYYCMPEGRLVMLCTPPLHCINCTSHICTWAATIIGRGLL